MEPAPADQAGQGPGQVPDMAAGEQAVPRQTVPARPAGALPSTSRQAASVAFGSFVESFCSKFSAGLGQMLSLPVQTQLLNLEQLSYGAFRAAAQEAGTCYVLAEEQSSPIQEPQPVGCLEICPELAYVMIDRLLGGSHEGAFIPARPLTSLERNLLRRVAALTAESLARAWPTYPPALRVAEDQPAPPPEPGAIYQESVWAATFALKVSRYDGALRLAIPLRWVSWGSADGASKAGGGEYATQRPLTSGAQGSVELSAAVEGAAIALEDLASLAPGDVVTTDSQADGEVIVRIAGIPKFAARLGSSNGRRAITITRRIQ